MTNNDFDKIITDTIEEIKNTLLVKAKEYQRNKNPFHNFDVGSKRTGLIREKVLDGFLLKHEISIADMTNDLERIILPKIEIVNEKFNDNIIYLLLKKASIIDKINIATRNSDYYDLITDTDKLQIKNPALDCKIIEIP